MKSFYFSSAYSAFLGQFCPFRGIGTNFWIWNFRIIPERCDFNEAWKNLSDSDEKKCVSFLHCNKEDSILSHRVMCGLWRTLTGADWCRELQHKHHYYYEGIKCFLWKIKRTQLPTNSHTHFSFYRIMFFLPRLKQFLTMEKFETQIILK